MARNRFQKSAPKVRRKAPRIEQSDDGIAIYCPFCHPPHRISLDTKATCGTILELTAVQTLYQDVTCSLCGNGQGTLLKIGESYRHAHDCSPGKTIYTVPPKKSRSAALAWKFPDWASMLLAKRLNLTSVQLTSGNVIDGYAWDKVKKNG